jgi:hypothetical protein
MYHHGDLHRNSHACSTCLLRWRSSRLECVDSDRVRLLSLGFRMSNCGLRASPIYVSHFGTAGKRLAPGFVGHTLHLSASLPRRLSSVNQWFVASVIRPACLPVAPNATWRAHDFSNDSDSFGLHVHHNHD